MSTTQVGRRPAPARFLAARMARTLAARLWETTDVRYRALAAQRIAEETADAHAAHAREFGLRLDAMRPANLALRQEVAAAAGITQDQAAVALATARGHILALDWESLT